MEIGDDDKDALFRFAARRFLDESQKRLQQRGHCVIGIVGGRAIPDFLRAVVRDAGTLPGTLHFFWLDERLSNEKNFLETLPILEELNRKCQVTWYPIVSTDIAEAKAELTSTMERLQHLGGSFDLVILSAGEDGHVASLFPGHGALNVSEKRYVILQDAPKPPPVRVTVSPGLLRTAGQAFLFFVGRKQQAYAAFKSPEMPAAKCPAKLLTAVPLDVFTSLQP